MRDDVKAARRQRGRARVDPRGIDRRGEMPALRRDADLPSADALAELFPDRILDRVRNRPRIAAARPPAARRSPVPCGRRRARTRRFRSDRGSFLPPLSWFRPQTAPRYSSAAATPPVLCGMPGAVQAHLDAAQRAAQHQIVEMAEMADAEHLALDLAEPGAERHVDRRRGSSRAAGPRRTRRAPAPRSANSSIRRSFWHSSSRPQARDRAPRRLAVAGVAGEDRRQPLLVEQHLQRLAQAEQQVGARRIREIAGLPDLGHRRPSPSTSAAAWRALRRLPAPFPRPR